MSVPIFQTCGNGHTFCYLHIAMGDHFLIFQILLVHTGGLEALCFGPAVTSMLCQWLLKVFISIALSSHEMALNDVGHLAECICKGLQQLDRISVVLGERSSLFLQFKYKLANDES